MNIMEKLAKRISELKNPTVAGLDTRIEYLPENFVREVLPNGIHSFEDAAKAVYAYNVRLIDALCDIVPAVKVQVAYYEMYGPAGMEVYEKTIRYAHEKGLIVMADVKRNDIGATAACYANAYVGKTDMPDGAQAAFGADIATINPYLGVDGIKPFTDACRDNGTGVFVLVKTSNPSSGQLQDMRFEDGRTLYQAVADLVETWGEETRGESGYSAVGAVVGATYPEEQSRELVRMLSERYGRVFIHGGGGAEQAFAEEMERTYPNVTALYGKVRFAGEMDLIANLDCVVTMDSLVMHLASLVATPVVSVWGATHPGLGFLGYGVSSGNVLQADMASSVRLINSAVYAMQMLQAQMAGEAENSGLTSDEAVMDLVKEVRAESEL